MLTQITWWGGIIFVVGALVYLFTMKTLEKQEQGIHWYRLGLHAFFIFPAIVLAGYFYPPKPVALQYVYLALLSVALLISLTMPILELLEDSSEDTQDPSPADPTTEPKEETGPVATFFGALLLYGPSWIACGLGCWATWPLVQKLLIK